MRGQMNIRAKKSGQWSQKFLAAVGTWVMAAPSLLGSALELLRIDVIIGATLVIVAGFNYGRRLAKEPTHGGAIGLSLVLGLFLIVFPFYYEVSRQIFWNDVISGVLIVSISVFEIHSTISTSR
jgi:hypothetical protein